MREKNLPKLHKTATKCVTNFHIFFMQSMKLFCRGYQMLYLII